MKTVLLGILFLMCFLNTKVQQNDTFLMNDTVFISRSFESGEYHAIFIEKDTNSKYYSWLTNFTFNEYDRQAFYISDDNKNALKKFDLRDLPQNWCPLYLYQDKFYLYGPSDGAITQK